MWSSLTKLWFRRLRDTLTPLCTEPLNELFVQGLFAVRQASNRECVYLQSSVQHFTDSNELFIELDLSLEPTTHEYCAEAILNGREKIIVNGRELVSLHVTSIWLSYCLYVHRYISDECESADFSAGAAAGIAVTITLLVALPVGVVIGLGVAWWIWRRGQSPTSEGPQQKMEQQLQGADYEEPLETVIPLRDNLAYGHVDLKRKN